MTQYVHYKRHNYIYSCNSSSTKANRRGINWQHGKMHNKKTETTESLCQRQMSNKKRRIINNGIKCLIWYSSFTAQHSETEKKTRHSSEIHFYNRWFC